MIGPGRFITTKASPEARRGGYPKEGSPMAKKLFKCFTCGKLYEDEQKAMRCHNAPVQKVVQVEGTKRPPFLGA